MELEDLKRNWQLLNRRLEKTEVLNQKIVQEMLIQRTDTIYNKIYKTELTGLLLSVCFISINCFIYLIASAFIPIEWFIILNIAFIFTVIWQLTKIFRLKKFNIETKNIYELSKIIIIYKKWIQREIISCIPLFPVLLGIWLYYNIHLLTPFLILLTVTITVAAIIYNFIWYFCIFSKNIRNIQKSLDELEDFYEEKLKN